MRVGITHAYIYMYIGDVYACILCHYMPVQRSCSFGPTEDNDAPEWSMLLQEGQRQKVCLLLKAAVQHVQWCGYPYPAVVLLL